MVTSRVASPSDEFADADFGDARLTRRLMRIADAAAKAPAAGLPEVAGSDGELEGIYRFLRNERVTPFKILASHFTATMQRARDRSVVIAHDTTEFSFRGASRREGLGRVYREKGVQGFFGHFALAVEAGSRRPLGLVGLKTIVREKPPHHLTRLVRELQPDLESKKWTDVAVQVGVSIPHAVHVMDREADSYMTISRLIEAKLRFVVRLCRDKKLVGSDEKMFAAAARGAVVATRSVPLSRRALHHDPRAKRIHPPRSERVAKLQIRATGVELKRPDRRRYEQGFPESLKVNVVLVEEIDPPPGETPVCWKLVTTEPVSTTSEIEAVVDAYRARWSIEEFFRALKTGCSYQKRQLESFRTLVNALAVFAVIAWRLLLLRAIARLDPNLSADEALSRRQVEVLQTLSRMKDDTVPRIHMPSASPTAGDVLLAVAQLGGHIKNNGPPGWQVLGRGYESLLLIELGWMTRERSDR